MPKIKTIIWLKYDNKEGEFKIVIEFIMKMNSTEERVLNIVKSKSFMGEEVKREDEFSTIGINSIDLVDLIVSIEDEFGICFSDSILNVDKFRTIEDIITFVNNQLSDI